VELHTNNTYNSGRAFLATVLFLLLLAVSISFFSYNFRIIKTGSGFHVVEKSVPAFDTPYVDMTDWGVKQLFEFRNIAYELINAGYGSEIPQVAMKAAKRIDKEYGVSEKMKEGMDKAEEAARGLWEKVQDD